MTGQIALEDGSGGLLDGQVPGPFRTDALIAFLGLLSDLPDGGAVGFGICRGLLNVYGADLALVYAARPDRRALDLVAHYGMEPRATAVYSIVTPDMHLPGVEAYRVGQEKWLTQQQVLDDYPLASPFFRVRAVSGEFAFIPIRHRGAPIGFIVVGFPQQVEKDWKLRSTLDGLTSAISLWLLAHVAYHGERIPNSTPLTPLHITPRQREVLVMLREGNSVNHIAQSLGYAVSTIKADIAALGSMLGSTGREDLLDKAQRAGL